MLKLAAADVVPSPAYVVFDAKNIVVSPISASTFFVKDGRAYTKRADATAAGRTGSFLRNALTVFGATVAEASLERSLPTVTPMVLWSDLVIDMKAALWRRHAQRPAAVIAGEPQSTEFQLYAGYLWSSDLVNERYEFSGHMSSVTLYTVGPPTSAGLQKAIRRMGSATTVFIGCTDDDGHYSAHLSGTRCAASWWTEAYSRTSSRHSVSSAYPQRPP